MDVNQLRTLICVAEHGSLSKAADRLCTAQPALSRQMRLLEEELGTRLFERHGRGMVLTDKGRGVLRHAMKIMGEFEDLRASVTDENSIPAGRVAIGMPPSVAEILALPLIAALRQSHPAVICRIVSAYSMYLLDFVHRGEVDITIIYDPQSIRSLKAEPLVEEALWVVAPAGAGLATGTPCAFRELQDHPLVLPGPNHSLRQIVERAADDCGIHLDVKVEADSFSVLKQLIQNGHGWTVLPLAPMQAEIAAGRFCGAPLIDPAPKRVLELGVSPDRPASRLTSLVHDAIIATTRQLVARSTWPAKLRIG